VSAASVKKRASQDKLSSHQNITPSLKRMQHKRGAKKAREGDQDKKAENRQTKDGRSLKRAHDKPTNPTEARREKKKKKKKKLNLEVAHCNRKDKRKRTHMTEQPKQTKRRRREGELAVVSTPN